MFWIKADPGMGKSTFLASVIQRYESSQQVLGYFFCKYGDKRRSDAKSLIKSIGYQIALRYSNHREWLLQESKDAKNKTIEELIDTLLISPLKDTPATSPLILVIDALDEIGNLNSKERKELLSGLNKICKKLPSHVRLIVSSRPEPDIVSSCTQSIPYCVEADDPRHREDLRLYAKSILKGHLVDEDEKTLEGATDVLVEISEGRFIYIAMIAEQLQNGDKLTIDQLKEHMPEGLNGQYLKNFERIRDINIKSYHNEINPLLSLIVACQDSSLAMEDARLILNTISQSGITREHMIVLADRVKEMFPLISPVVNSSNALEERKFQAYHKTVIDWLTDGNQLDIDDKMNSCRCPVMDGKISLWWLQSIVSDPDSQKNRKHIPVLLDFLEQKDLCQFDPSLISYLDKIFAQVECLMFRDDLKSEIKKALEELFGNSSTPAFPIMARDYYVDIHKGHELYCDGLLSQLGHYDRDNRTITIDEQTVSSHRPYLYNHIVDHLRLAGTEWLGVIVSLFSQLSWLQTCFRQCANGVVHVLKNIQEVIRDLGHNVDARDENIQFLKYLSKALLLNHNHLKDLQLEHPDDVDKGLALDLIGRMRRIEQMHCQQLCRQSMEYLRKQKINPVKYDLTPLNNSCENIIQGHTDRVVSSCMLPNGRMASGSDDKTIRIWSMRDGEWIQESVLKGHTHTITSLCVLSDVRLASGSEDKTIRIWNIIDGEWTYESVLVGHTDPVTSLCLLSDGRLVSGSNDNTIRIWNMKDDEWIEEAVLTGRNFAFNSLCVLSDGRLVSGLYDNTIRIWNMRDGEWSEESTLKGHTSYVTSLCVLSDGRLASGSEDKTIRIWRMKDGEWNEENVLKGHTNEVSSLCVLPDGRLASGSYDNMIRIWKMRASEWIVDSVLRGHTDSVTTLCLLSDGRLTSGSYDKTIREWNLNDDELIQESVLQGHTHTVTSLCVLSDGRWVSGSNDRTIRIWNTKDGEWIVESVLVGHTDNVTSLCVLSDGRMASGSEDETIRIWNITDGEWTEQSVLRGHTESVTTLCVLSDGRLASGSYDKTIRIWKFTDGEWIAESVLEGQTMDFTTLCVLSDGRLASDSSDNIIRIWNVKNGEFECCRVIVGDCDQEGYRIIQEVRKGNQFHVIDETLKCIERIIDTVDCGGIHCRSIINPHLLALGTKTGRMLIFSNMN